MDHEQEHKKDHDKEHGNKVSIVVDGKTISITRGHKTISEIKLASNIPLAYDLEQVENGTLVLLTDDGSLTIKGDEIFVSHPKDSSSS